MKYGLLILGLATALVLITPVPKSACADGFCKAQTCTTAASCMSPCNACLGHGASQFGRCAWIR